MNCQRTPIEDLASMENSLQPGDHICWEKPYVIWHHALVLRVIDVDNGLLEVVHWYPGDTHLAWKSNKIKIRKEQIDINQVMGDLYRINYSNQVHEINPLELVMARIECEMANQGVYGLLNNNCECYATYCRQGVSKSQQKVWICGKVKEWMSGAVVRVLSIIFRIFLELLVSEIVEEVVEEIGERQHENSTAKVHVGPLNQGAKAIAGSLSLGIYEEQGQDLQRYSCPNIYQMIGVAMFTFFELVVFLWHFKQYRSQWAKGNIYRGDYCLRVLSGFTEFLLRTILGSICSIVAECEAINKFHPDKAGQNPTLAQNAIIIAIATFSGLGGAILGQVLMHIVCFTCRCGKIIAKCITGKDYRVITSLDQLSPGAHIIYDKKRRCLSHRHGIIISTNLRENSLQQIYHSRETGNVQAEYSFDSLWRVYKVYWAKEASCSSQETVDRALGRLRQNSDPSFTPYSSKQFAYWCKSRSENDYFFDC